MTYVYVKKSTVRDRETQRDAEREREREREREIQPFLNGNKNLILVPPNTEKKIRI